MCISKWKYNAKHVMEAIVQVMPLLQGMIWKPITPPMYPIIRVYFHLAVPAMIERSGLELRPKVIENRTHILECPVEGIPIPSIKWHKNGEEIDFQEIPGFAIGASGQKLVIQSAKVEHTGDYECIAENDAGTDRLQYRLEVYGTLSDLKI